MLMLLSAFCPSPLRHRLRQAARVPDLRGHKNGFSCCISSCEEELGPAIDQEVTVPSCNIRQQLHLLSVLFFNFIAKVRNWQARLHLVLSFIVVLCNFFFLLIFWGVSLPKVLYKMLIVIACGSQVSLETN